MNKLLIILSLIFTVSCQKQDETVVEDISPKAPSILSYSLDSMIIQIGSPIESLLPTEKDGEDISFVVTPALPAGLLLNQESGLISGTPILEQLEKR